jgi:hypothetical protein
VNVDVRTTPEADDQVRVIDGWWQRHRIAAPTPFLDELEAAFSLIATDLTLAARIDGHRSPAPGVFFCPVRDTTSTTSRAKTWCSSLPFGMPSAAAAYRCASRSLLGRALGVARSNVAMSRARSPASARRLHSRASPHSCGLVSLLKAASACLAHHFYGCREYR